MFNNDRTLAGAFYNKYVYVHASTSTLCIQFVYSSCMTFPDPRHVTRQPTPTQNVYGNSGPMLTQELTNFEGLILIIHRNAPKRSSYARLKPLKTTYLKSPGAREGSWKALIIPRRTLRQVFIKARSKVLEVFATWTSVRQWEIKILFKTRQERY